jgi:predicted alpha/beta superfamily hydrolase
MNIRPLGLSLLFALSACAMRETSETSESSIAHVDPRVQKSTVVVHYPAGWGHRIAVRGSGAGLDWTTGRDATHTDDDAWVLSVDLESPIELKPLYDDGTWAKGPNWKLAPGQTLDVWPVFFHEAGRIERRARWHHDGLPDRDVVIYLPPSYDENWHERYPVVYMHDGQNLWDDASAFGGTSWNVRGAMDAGFLDGSIHEAIVVGIDNTSARFSEYTPGDGGRKYLDFVANGLKPIIDREFRTLAAREHTGIMGSSLGGLISAFAGLSRPETFGLVGAVSPSTWWNGTWIVGQVRNAETIPVRVYVDSGDSGAARDDVVNTAELARAYRDRQANLKYIVQNGASHNEYWWRQRLPGAFMHLLGPR